MNSSLILCDNKTDYFFNVEERVFSVFSNKNSIVLRLFNHFKIHCFDYLFWGPWKKKISKEKIKNIIVFDVGYDTGFENRLQKRFKDVNVYYFTWNPINNERMEKRVRSFYKQSNVLSSCPTDCESYHLRFVQVPYSLKWESCFSKGDNHRAVWVGADKGRFNKLKEIDTALQACGIESDIRILFGANNEYSAEKRMSYSDYSNLVSKSSYIIDISQDGQSGITLRVPEAIFFQKKLITNNKTVLTFPFYTPNNIFVVDFPIDIEKLKSFINAPFKEYSEDVKVSFDINTWLCSITEDSK